jgi:hypothetical protein
LSETYLLLILTEAVSVTYSAHDLEVFSVMAKNSFHVVPNPKGGWAVKRANSPRASKNFDTKADAIVWGKKISKSDSAEFVVHGRDGTIKSRDTFAEDPKPYPDASNRK